MMSHVTVVMCKSILDSIDCSATALMSADTVHFYTSLLICVDYMAALQHGAQFTPIKVGQSCLLQSSVLAPCTQSQMVPE